MAANNARLNAVIAALEKVREHVEKLPDDDDVDIEAYNRWVGMLDGVVEGNWESLEIDTDLLPASEMLMHVEAAIAFLKAHQSA